MHKKLTTLKNQSSDQVEEKKNCYVTCEQVVKYNTPYGVKRTEKKVTYSVYAQNEVFWAEGSSMKPVQITEDIYKKLLQKKIYHGNAWEFESQYLGGWGHDWESILKH